MALHSSWNWELISDKPLDWWLPKIAGIKKAHPDRVLVASIMAGSGSDRELAHWQTLARGCQDAGADAFELNLSCPHMDRKDMGSNIGKDTEQVSIVTQVVKEVATVPVWAKLTPSTTDIVVEARGAFLGGADAIVSSNTFPSLPLIDPATLEFEMHVDGFVSSGGLGGPPSCRSRAPNGPAHPGLPDKAFSASAASRPSTRRSTTSCSAAARCRCARRRCLTTRSGRNIIKALNAGMAEFFARHGDKGWHSLEDIRGIRRDRVVSHSQIKRPDTKEYFGGRDAPGLDEAQEGYAEQAASRG